MSEPREPGPGEQWPNPYLPPGQQSSGMSTGAQIAIGATAGTIAVAGASFLFTVMLGAASSDGSLIVFGWLPLLVVIGGLFWKPVRWYAVGTLIGLAVLAIVFAGVCLALIAMLSNAEFG